MTQSLLSYDDNNEITRCIIHYRPRSYLLSSANFFLSASRSREESGEKGVEKGPIDPVFPLPLGPVQFQGDKILKIGTLKLDRIPLPPRVASPELKGRERWKDVVVEKPTQPAGIVAADLKRLPFVMASVTGTIHSEYCARDLVADRRFFRHSSDLLV